MKKNSLKVMVAALAAVMVIGVVGIGIAKTSAGFKFTAKSEDVAVSAADFTAEIVEDDGTITTLDNTTTSTKSFKLTTLDQDALLFSGTEAPQVSVVTVKNTGSVKQKITFTSEVAANDSSKSNDVALEERVVVVTNYSISGAMPVTLDPAVNSIELEAGESVRFSVFASGKSTEANPDVNTGADNEAINGIANVNATIDITPIR